MQLHIRYYGHPILRKRCRPIEKITAEIHQLAQDMIETMDKTDGIGLAAPQVGQDLRMFVLRNYIPTEEGGWTLSEPQVYINPKLSHPGNSLIADTEGCLSIPGLRCEVERPDGITVQAVDLMGNEFSEEVEGYNARVRMHENDHLNGVLFIDRLEPSKRKQINAFLRKIRKEYP